MKTLSFAGFKIKVITCRLLPQNRVYAFTSHSQAKNFIAILELLNNLITANKLRFVRMKPKEKIIRPS